jgi:hypothetical protein
MTETVEKLGINETLEILEGAKVLSVAVSGALKDGKIGLADLQYAVELAKQFDVFKDAVTGAEKAIPEAKDLDSAEAAIILAKVFEIVAAIRAVKA